MFRAGALSVRGLGTKLLKPQWAVPIRSLHATAPRFAEKGLLDHKNVDELFQNNEAWRAGVLKKDPDFFKRMATSQSPRYLWIGCSDSRVPAETITGLQPGTLFVHRNVANQVNGLDMSAQSVIQFSVGVLKVQHIVVCGHYNCGGVAASMRNVDHMSPLENWLRGIRDVYRLHADELNAIKDIEARTKKVVEMNVLEQCVNLYKTHVVQARRVETYKELDFYGFVQPRIHPVVYDPATGKLERLDVQLHEYVEKVRGIYNLYSAVDKDNIEWEGMGNSTALPFQSN